MEYLTAKWKSWFKMLDSDSDGKLTQADMKTSCRRFEDIRKKLGDKLPHSCHDNEAWWKKYIFRNGPDVDLTAEQFADAFSKAYSQDRQAFVSEMQTCFGDVANVVASDKARPIDVDEFTFGFKVFGQDDTEKIAGAFRKFAASGDPVNTQRMVDAWVQFITDDDQTKLDLIKESFCENL